MQTPCETYGFPMVLLAVSFETCDFPIVFAYFFMGG